MEDKIFNKIFKLMETSFPKTEFRTREDQKKLLDNKFYNLKPYFNDKNEILAFIATWEFSDFIFVEHIAVSPNARGMGLGTKIMDELINSTNKKIVLEIEPPTDETCVRRMKFYEKLGFKMNDYEYFQMPLRENQDKIPLKIMSYPAEIKKDAFKSVEKCILNNVYNVN